MSNADYVLDRQGQYVASVVERIAYKPGWEFHVEPCGQVPGWLWLVARSQEPDSRGKGQREQWRTYVMAAHGTISKILATVRMAIQTWELHETDEWFRFDGERIHDPHACDECVVGNLNHHALARLADRPGNGREATE